MDVPEPVVFPADQPSPPPQEEVTPSPQTGEIDWVDQYLNQADLKRTSIRAYQTALRQFQAFMDKPLSEISVNDVDRYAAHLRKKGLAARTILVHNAAITKLFEYLDRRGLVSQNPARFLKSPRIPDPQHLDIKPEAADRLRETAATAPRYRLRAQALLEVLMHGLRAGEVVTLNVGDYYPSDDLYEFGRLEIREAKWGSNGSVPLLSAKSQQIVEAYLGWLQEWGQPKTPRDPLFCSMHANHKGNRITYDGVYDIFRRLARQSDVFQGHSDQPINPHVARHAFALQLIRMGMDPDNARRLTRHTNLRSFSIYADQAQQEAAVRQAITLSKEYYRQT